MVKNSLAQWGLTFERQERTFGDTGIADLPPDTPDNADNLAETGIVAAAEIMDGLLEPVRDLVEHAESLEAIRDGLIGLYPDMDEAAFGELMQRALTAGELAGRAEVGAGG